MEAVIEARGVWKWYGHLIANQDINLEVRRGEIVSLLGPNGAGKTTLVKQIYGEITPNKGEVRVLGQPPTNAKVKRRMGVIPQECRPYDDLSVWDNVYYMGRIKGVSKEESNSRAEELLAKLGLSESKNKMTGDLSGGMKRKLLIAMAVINDPELIILDEPTTGLDPSSRREVWEMLQGLRKAGRSMLLTTHYLDEAERLSDRIYFINRKIIASGTTSEIKERFSEWYEVIDYTTGEVRKVRGEEVKRVIQEMKGKFEVRLPSLEDIYLEMIRSAE